MMIRKLVLGGSGLFLLKAGVMALAPPLPLYYGDWQAVSGTVNGTDVDLTGSCITLGHSIESIYGKAACNSYYASVDMGGLEPTGSMSVHSLIQTEELCSDELNALESIFLQSLLTATDYDTADDTPELIIRGPGSEWVFYDVNRNECAQPLPSISVLGIDGDWVGQQASVNGSEVEQVELVSMRLSGSELSVLSGRAGCNQYETSIEIDVTAVSGSNPVGPFLVTSDITASEMECPESGLMDLEEIYLDSLKKFETFRYSGIGSSDSWLHLEGPDVAWWFERSPNNTTTAPPMNEPLSSSALRLMSPSMTGVAIGAITVALFGLTLV